MHRAHLIITVLNCVALSGHATAIIVDFDQVSDPVGLFGSEHSLEETGTEVTTITAPYDIGSNRFVYWLLDGNAPRGDYDYPLNPISFIITQPTVVTARYVDVSADSDADGIYDWYELQVYTSLTNDAASDTDGDGIPFAQEVERGWHPRIPNETRPGVIARSRSPVISVVNDTNLAWYTFQSDPIGLLTTTQQVLSNGTEIVLSGVPFETGDYTFVGWSINGVRQGSPVGASWLLETSFVLNGASTATAHYVATDTDSNSDGIPDVYELWHLGTNGLDAAQDYDGDGLTLAEEYQRGFSPAIPNTILPGVIGRDRASMEGVTSPDPNDADADGIPDDWEREYFGTINQTAGSDADGDTYTLLQEYKLRLHPLIKNTITAGVIARSRSQTFPANLAGWPPYTIRSQPIGLIATDQGYVEPGTMLTTPVAPASTGGYVFRDWEVDGVSVRNAYGYPEDQAAFTVTGETEAVAHYLLPDEDADADGIPDLYEYTIYGGLHVHGDDDSDGDGLTMAEERERGTSPVVANTILPGVISRSRSATLNVDLQFFRRSQYVLVNGREEAFFSAEAGTNGTYAAVSDTAPALGDWDGDGDLDLFVGSGSGMMDAFQNTGSPLVINWVDRTTSFAALTSNWSDIDRPAPALGDWSLDGRADLAVGGRTGVVRLVESAGDFATPLAGAAIEITVPSSNAVPAFADVNGDGLTDLLVLLDDGTVDAWHHTGIATNPYAAFPSANDILPVTVANATGLSGGRLNDDDLEDVLVSDDGGQVWEFRQQGDHTFSVISQIYGGTYEGFANRLTISSGDPDGDGDADMVAGFAEGGLLYLRNDEDHLLIDPPSLTLVSGSSETFGALNAPSAVAWSFVANRSGGTLDPVTGAYAAGPTHGVVDVIEGRIATGLRGRSYVNVISEADVTAAGKAVIVAGGKALNDPVWTATDHVADFAYRALRFRGFSRTNIQYLSFGPSEDVDGNGLLDDVDGPSTFASTADTFTNWVGNAAKLFVYMADHGSSTGGAGQMRLNSGEVLTAATLDGWLDDLQDTWGMDVILVMDFCYAGSFLDELTYPGPAKRIVISATAEDELTYFIARGVVSFSDVFFNAVFQGFDLKSAFELAEDAMSRYQHGGLDDDGNGIYEVNVDGAVAEQEVVGASFIVGRDFPYINEVIPDTALTNGTSVEVWAGDISSSYPLERVWVSITPPSHNPDAGSGVPVVDLPDVDLEYNRSTRRYEAVIEGLSEPGPYRLLFFARDIWGGVSLPKIALVTQGDIDERAILVAGGPTSAANWPAISNLANMAYTTLQARRFSAEQIDYLNPVLQDLDGDGTNDVDAVGSLTNLASGIGTWAAAADRLTVYLIGEETNGMFRINGTEALDAATLDGWLDGFQVSNRAVTVVLDFSGSGAWVPALTAPADRERIVVASSAAGRKSLLDEASGFSAFLLREVLQGKSLGEAVTTARRAVRRASGNVRQKALIDDTGNGTANEKNTDGLLARARYLGAAFVTGEDIPNIGAVIPPQTLSNTTSGVLWVDEVTDADGIARVWCELTPPTNFLGAASVVLELTETNSRWEVAYAGFTEPGPYAATFFAEDTTGETSAGVQTEILQTDSNVYALIDGALPDSFEPDNVSSNAVYSDLPLIQVHTLHVSNDCDWVRFYATDDQIYDIETVHLDTNSTIDTLIELYREEADGTLTLLDTVDEFGRDEGELTGLDFPTNGFYLVRVCQAVDADYAPGAYLLVVYVPAGFQGVNVRALDILAGGVLPGATVRLKNGSGGVLGTGVTGGDGYVRFTGAGPGTYRVEVVAPGAPGEFLRQYNPNSASQGPDEPASDYGNERLIGSQDFGVISYNNLVLAQGTYLAFGFIPVAYLEGSVWNGLTGEPVAGAALGIRRESDGYVFSRYPWASYAPYWQTDIDGQFPGTVIVPPNTVMLPLVIRNGYADYSHPNPVATPSRGQTLDLGNLVLSPTYGGNSIPDFWELSHGLSTNVDVTLNPDGDLLTHAEEWIAGTNPNDGGSFFQASEATRTGAGLTLRWVGAPGRWYRVWRNEDLTNPDGWIPVHGPIQHGPSYDWMEWSDPDSSALEAGHYRIEVSGP